MKQTLNLKVSQQLSLTAQLKQSLRLLQLSAVDLEPEIQQALDTNPLLERGENQMDFLTPEIVGEAAQSVETAQPAVDDSDQSLATINADDMPEEQALGVEWQEAFEPHRTGPAKMSTSGGNEFAPQASRQETLFDHLSWQIQMTALTDKDKQIAETILYCLDEDGYLCSELTDICTLFPPEMMIETDEINAVLSLIKTLDPVGVGASNLSERLLILLNQVSLTTPGLDTARHIVTAHLPLMAARNFTKLRRLLDISEKDLAVSLDLIRLLNPRIGNCYKPDQQDYIIPDILVKKLNGVWVARLNSDNQTKLRTNQTYTDLLKSRIGKTDSDFIQQNLTQAKMFIKGLNSRYDTLLLVGQAIVERQQAFFEQGQEQMQPMVLQDIAQQLEMHESTISRATAGKYLLCASGVFELKYFFSSALASAQGNASSSTAIRALIKKMVDNESKVKPLSDSKIAAQLEQQGHLVARRTIAKYRESMQIVPSSQRKLLQ